jgi:hypothetical protein
MGDDVIVANMHIEVYNPWAISESAGDLGDICRAG